ncbi:hypothetical protein OAB00_02300 [Akkermansiaceae bacterium]|nr:hypothetical protein [Akkermansiaceae bacterium]
MKKPSIIALILALSPILALLFSSCDDGSSSSNSSSSATSDTTATADIDGEGIDTDFQYIVDRFLVEAEKRGLEYDLAGLDIQYDTTGFTYLGLCSGNASNRDITINSTFFLDQPAILLEEIVLHELGHCVLGRSHTATNSTDSIMCATCIVGDPWNETILDELFGASIL